MRLRIIHVRSDGSTDLPIRRSLGDATVESLPAAKLVRHVERDAAAVFVVDVDLKSPESVLAIRAGLGRSPSVPTVFVTERGQRAEETQAQALGADAMVTRPIDGVSLELAIRSVLPRAVAAGLAHAASEDPGTLGAVAASSRAVAAMIDGFRSGQAPSAEEVGEWTRDVTEDVDAAGLDSFVSAIRTAHAGAAQHSLMVAGVAARFGANLGLPPSERSVLTAAALVHDVGAVRLPPELYDRLDRLSEAEFKIVRKHPVQGAAHLAEAGLDPRVVAAVRHHHEFLDGSGFPDGLSGADIPSIARLIAICDIFAGLIGQRSYKLPAQPDVAFRKLETMAEEGRLDAALVAAFRSTAAELAGSRGIPLPGRAGTSAIAAGAASTT